MIVGPSKIFLKKIQIKEINICILYIGNKEITIKRLDKYNNYNNCLGKDISIHSNDCRNEGYFTIIEDHRDAKIFTWKTNEYEGTG